MGHQCRGVEVAIGGVEQEARRRVAYQEAGHLPGQHAVVAVPGAVGDTVDHGIAAAREDQELVLVGAGVVEVLAFAEGFDAHGAGISPKLPCPLGRGREAKGSPRPPARSSSGGMWHS
jgi:hypothetical protein